MSQFQASDLSQADVHEFLGALSHELRGPLAPLSNGLQILKFQGIESQMSRDILSLMERQVRQLTGLLDNLLEVSRLVRGKVALRQDHFDLGRLARVVFDEFSSKLRDSQLQFGLAVPETPVWVIGDAVRIARAVSNLLHNAMRFTPAGGSVQVRLETDASGQEARLSIRDTGLGIGADRLPNLFRPFPAASSEEGRKAPSLGLGLALVKTVIEQHGGQVTASSAGTGQGSEFAIRLPLQPEPASIAAGVSYPRLSSAHHLRILVIEDNRDSAESLRMLLSACGYDVEVSYTGTEGVKAAQETRPDVVLCDIGLPGLNGYEVVTELRRHAETAGARVIALTGYGTEEDRRKSKLAGFDLHLVKPVDPNVLQGLLAESEAGG